MGVAIAGFTTLAKADRASCAPSAMSMPIRVFFMVCCLFNESDLFIRFVLSSPKKDRENERYCMRSTYIKAVELVICRYSIRVAPPPGTVKVEDELKCL